MTSLTPEQQAVIDAAVKLHQAFGTNQITVMEATHHFTEAVRALLSTPEYREKNDG